VRIHTFLATNPQKRRRDLIPVNVKFPLTRVIVIKLNQILAVLRRQESFKIKKPLNNTT